MTRGTSIELAMELEIAFEVESRQTASKGVEFRGGNCYELALIGLDDMQFESLAHHVCQPILAFRG